MTPKKDIINRTQITSKSRIYSLVERGTSSHMSVADMGHF